MNRWVLVAATLLTATALGVSAAVMARDEAAVLAGDEDARGLSETAEETYGEGDTNVVFHTLGQVAATARLVLRGRVVDVGQGDPEKYTDGSGVTRVPRLIVVDVKEVLSPSAMEQTPPSRIRIYDGFWENGPAMRATPCGGRSRETRVLDGEARARPSGRAVLVLHPGEPRWPRAHRRRATRARPGRAVGASGTRHRRRGPGRTRRCGAGGQERRGARRPTKVCHPSVPGDENSEPVCVLD